eukprot:CAMPEP_0194144140 /NCGR_PEP_ID=MMETSP0152-20130528/13220_1 /TAXON_ID=1049557 /ORGANISM="Thalassiothrix antarctica, Strain L6-D1" /LENGTH=351 /DNA_ID=CAMNT_0038843857 /DNA_START=139 /DNA_END=1194 /DNA_ORIENTATION=-
MEYFASLLADDDDNNCGDTTLHNGKLCVFGEPSSPVMALLCAGYPDDHTVFLPFAKALSESKGKGNILVGVMCIPGYDDRPEDDLPWQNHPRKGFSFDETAKAVREAAKALRGVSTHKNPELVGIFHDFGVVPGSIWAKQLEQEAKDNPSVPLKPNKMIFFDVLPQCKGDKTGPTLHQTLYYTYMLVFAFGSLLQTYVSRYLAVAFVYPIFMLLSIIGILPLYEFDYKLDEFNYKFFSDGGLLRSVHMMYMYRLVIVESWSKKTRAVITLHENWKAMPILYLYGKKKRSMFHTDASLAMLEREETEKQSLSRVIGIEGAGHWFYVPEQKLEECCKYVADFILAENTFVATS